MLFTFMLKVQGIHTDVATHNRTLNFHYVLQQCFIERGHVRV